MSKHQNYYKDNSSSMSKLYIVAQPTQKTDLTMRDLYVDGEDVDAAWLGKARRLQARRWRKIKHQTA